MEIARNNPRQMVAEVTSRCNSRCVHCPHGYSDFGQDMSPQVLRTIRESLLGSVEQVDFTGQGEALLADQVPEFMDECLRKGVRLRVTTNGLLLKKSGLLPKFLRGNVILVLSMDGATPETFDFVRPTIGWKRIIDTLEYIKATRDEVGASKDYRLHINFVVMKQNVGDLPELVRLAKNYGVHHILLIPLAHEGNVPKVADQSLVHAPHLFVEPFIEAAHLAWKDRIGLMTPGYFLNNVWSGGDGKDRQNVIRRAISVLRLGIAGTQTGLFRWSAATRSLRRLMGVNNAKTLELKTCPDPFATTYVGADGSVYACCTTHEQLGNLNTQSWDDVWNGPLYRNLRRTMRSWNPTSICRSCGCWWGILGGDGGYYSRYFGKFTASDIPLEGGEADFAEGFEPASADKRGRWMGRTGGLVVASRQRAKFLRIRIKPELPGARRIPGSAAINGGKNEPFDNSCAEIHLPLKDIAGERLDVRLQMEKTLEGEAQGRAILITGLQYLS